MTTLFLAVNQDYLYTISAGQLGTTLQKCQFGYHHLNYLFIIIIIIIIIIVTTIFIIINLNYRASGGAASSCSTSTWGFSNHFSDPRDFTFDKSGTNDNVYYYLHGVGFQQCIVSGSSASCTTLIPEATLTSSFPFYELSPATDSSNNLYVVDAMTNKLYKCIAPSYTSCSTFLSLVAQLQGLAFNPNNALVKVGIDNKLYLCSTSTVTATTSSSSCTENVVPVDGSGAAITPLSDIYFDTSGTLFVLSGSDVYMYKGLGGTSSSSGSSSSGSSGSNNMLGLIALVVIVPIGVAVALAVKGSAAAASATQGNLHKPVDTEEPQKLEVVGIQV